MRHSDLICSVLSKLVVKVAGIGVVFLDGFFFFFFLTNTDFTFCSLDLRHSFMECSPCVVTLHHPSPNTRRNTVSKGNALFISLAGAFAGSAEFSRLEEWEGSEEERPGRLSAAGRMVSLSDRCGVGLGGL